ncbi:MAG: hypothetical protein CGW95_10210 [Phenylobacterium zucineum]|nr:MAG: hypothetical protein CGW95_10210 [Phenylobacterium zucineum]
MKADLGWSNSAQLGTSGPWTDGTAIISSRTNEIGLTGPKNPQLPRGFASGNRTPETAWAAKIGL